MIHVGTFISLSSELAVAAAPRRYRSSKGLLYQRATIKELQVGEDEPASLCARDVTPALLSLCRQSRAPAVDWLGCLQAAFHPLPLSEDDHVLLHNLPYLVQMSRIIGKWLHNPELRTR